jgi:hypothetical protein
MLVIPGHNPMGNVIHMILGPESEMFSDIHGATILDVTPILSCMNMEEKVYLHLTRCRSEQQTEAVLKASNIAFFNTFSGWNNAPENLKQIIEKDKPQEIVAKIAKAKVDRCHYCNRETTLLPVPGFKICVVCAQIELGQKKKNTSQGKT